MMHFSCDLCGKMILPGDDQRYVVAHRILRRPRSRIDYR